MVISQTGHLLDWSGHLPTIQPRFLTILKRLGLGQLGPGQLGPRQLGPDSWAPDSCMFFEADNWASDKTRFYFP